MRLCVRIEVTIVLFSECKGKGCAFFRSLILVKGRSKCANKEGSMWLAGYQVRLTHLMQGFRRWGREIIGVA